MLNDNHFLIGAATAAHQVEGNNTHSDYWKQEHLKHSSFVEKSLNAVDHYNRYKEDIALLKEAGLNAYRFSIEWARIEPREGMFEYKEIEHYRDVINTCYEMGVTPIVTLYHFSSPAWLISKGGWGSAKVVDYFAKYVDYVTKYLKVKLPYIVTINEANMGFQLNKVAEDFKNNNKNGGAQVGMNLDMKKILLSMVEQGFAFHVNPLKVKTFLSPRTQEEERFVMMAHQKAKEIIKKNMPDSKVGLSMSLYDYQAESGGEANAEKLWEEDFLFYLPYIKDDDFLGVQNYSRKLVGPNGKLPVPAGRPKTQMGYEDYPQAIGHVVAKVAKSFHGEIIVTENGIATSDDSRRCEFIKEALQGIKESGVDIKGYFYWSLLDNFEWQTGYQMTFGLIAVDRTTMKRIPKESLYVLGKALTND
ncbi:MAG: family 1 glycosylhydrolase [Erysipelotrichaceae bacterium]|nr:family 1 glycosylhydrolase [Erysipelotrichaceae bacterium]